MILCVIQYHYPYLSDWYSPWGMIWMLKVGGRIFGRFFQNLYSICNISVMNPKLKRLRISVKAWASSWTRWDLSRLVESQAHSERSWCQNLIFPSESEWLACAGLSRQANIYHIVEIKCMQPVETVEIIHYVLDCFNCMYGKCKYYTCIINCKTTCIFFPHFPGCWLCGLDSGSNISIL